MITRLLPLALACSVPFWAAAGDLSGTAPYRERIAMPPEATFRAVLYDTSAAPVEIARAELPGDAGPPYEFTIAFDDAGVTAGGSYSIEVEVVMPDQVFFTAGLALDGFPASTPEVALLMRGPKPEPEATSPMIQGAHGLTLPATFAGDVTSGDQSETWRLFLAPDQSFQLSRTFGEDAATRRDSIGHWAADPSADRLILRDGAEMPLVVRRSGDGLQVIDPASGDALDGTLAATGAEPLELRNMLLGGMMTYLADAAVFEECLSGTRFSIAGEGAYLDLERAYLADRPAPGEPLYVLLEGGIAMRPAMEGPDRQTIVADRFVRTRPGITCERQRADASLANTYWRIDELNGEAFPVGAGEREPHIVLETTGGSFRATLGCNNMRGNYSLDGDRLTLQPLMSTMMACPPPLDALEGAFTALLSEIETFAIEGETLVLRDGAGAARAILTAVYF